MDSTATNPTEINNTPSNPTLIGNNTTPSFNDTIGFVSEGKQQPVEYNLASQATHQIHSIGDHPHTIEDILSRPTYIGTYTIQSSDVTGKQVMWFDFMEQFATATNQVRQKLNAFYAMKGTFCIRLTLNCEPFQTGAYLLWAAPYPYNSTPSLATAGWQAYSEYWQEIGMQPFMNVTNHSGYPSMIFNIGCTSEVVLKVPYIGTRPLMELNEIISCNFTLECLSGLRGSTNGEVAGVNAYIWMEDVELVGATRSSLTTSNWIGSNINGRVTLQSSSEVLSNIMAALKNLTPSQTQEAVAAQSPPAVQSGGGNGAVSGIADTVGNLASGLTAIPGVADIAGPVSWVAKGVSSVAKMFGFSKPHDPLPSKPFHQNPFREFTQVDSISEATKLTLGVEAATQVREIGPVKEDEMSIQYVVRRPVVFQVYHWRVTHNIGDCLWTQTLSPSDMFKYMYNKVGTLNKVALRAETYLSYLASMFIYYRGSFKFTFTLVCNKFYSGRLRVVMVLSDTQTDPSNQQMADVWANSNYHFSKIVDVRDANTWTIEFPYMDVNPFRRTRTALESHERVPRIYVFVENALKKSGTVNDQLDIWTSVSGGKDFMFQGPRLTNATKVLPPVKGLVSAVPTNTQVKLQGFTENQTSEQAPAEMEMTDCPHPHSSLLALTRVIGDPVTSLRALMKRPTEVCVIGIDAGTYTFINPFSTFTSTLFTDNGSYLQRIKSLYRFSTGSMRVYVKGLDRSQTYRCKLIDYSGIQTRLNVVLTGEAGLREVREADGETTADTFSNLPTICDIPYNEDLQGYMCFEIPYYWMYELLDNAIWTDSKSNTRLATKIQSDTTLALAWYNPVKIASGVSYYVAAGDDFNCGFLVGPPLTYGSPDDV